MSRFWSGVALSTSVTWSSQLLPKIVTTGRLGRDQLAQVGVVAGRVVLVAGRAEGGKPRVTARCSLRAAAKNSMSFGLEPGQPPSMNGKPYSSSMRATRSLSASERVMFSPCVPSRRVVS